MEDKWMEEVKEHFLEKCKVEIRNLSISNRFHCHFGLPGFWYKDKKWRFPLKKNAVGWKFGWRPQAVALANYHSEHWDVWKVFDFWRISPIRVPMLGKNPGFRSDNFFSWSNKLCVVIFEGGRRQVVLKDLVWKTIQVNTIGTLCNFRTVRLRGDGEVRKLSHHKILQK